MARGMEDLPERGLRCYHCYALRMEEAAKKAAEMGADYFSTTLSISPHKNAQWINEIGEKLADKYGVKHLPSDFKKKEGIYVLLHCLRNTICIGRIIADVCFRRGIRRCRNRRTQ